MQMTTIKTHVRGTSNTNPNEIRGIAVRNKIPGGEQWSQNSDIPLLHGTVVFCKNNLGYQSDI